MNDVTEIRNYATLIEMQAIKLGDKIYIMFEDGRRVSFKQFHERTCQAANGLAAQGGKPGDGMAIFMNNCPEYLYLFYGMPMGGFYSVPVNTGLKGEGLKYILTNSDVKYLVVDDVLYPKIAELGSLDAIQKIFVRRTSAAPLPAGTMDLESLLDAPSNKPDYEIQPDTMTYLMYTSGTTGLPKGVVFRNRTDLALGAAMATIAAGTVDSGKDILYTALPLFHANALTLSFGYAMAGGTSVGLDTRFSASRFWDRIRHYKATQCNMLGAMIPIIMKQPERPDDAGNTLRIVNSAACPINLWEAFEKRFGVELCEGYGAVDGGGISIMNRGDAPVGSVGKPAATMIWKLVDDDDNEVPQGEPGEFIAKVQDVNINVVDYYKNPEASKKKIVNGWVRSGDLFYADKEGYLYFVDRKTDSMRRRGENISSFEVENAVEKYPAVAECAAFGVPSELGENEVMIWVKPKEGKTIDLKELIHFCVKNMAYFMVPRFIDIVDDIPRTGTHRVQKGDMKKQGVTKRTWDREKEMPDLELKKS